MFLCHTVSAAKNGFWISERRLIMCIKRQKKKNIPTPRPCCSCQNHTTCTCICSWRSFQTCLIPYSRTKSACLTSLAMHQLEAYRLWLIKQLKMALNPHRKIIHHPAKDLDPTALYLFIHVCTSSLFSHQLNPKD